MESAEQNEGHPYALRADNEGMLFHYLCLSLDSSSEHARLNCGPLPQLTERRSWALHTDRL
jgi:hypothetical protein